MILSLAMMMFSKRKSPWEIRAQQAEKVLYDREHRKLLRKAEAGDIEASYVLARYWLGEGPHDQNIKFALGFLRKPATADYRDARMLAVMALLWGCNDDRYNSSFSSWCSLILPDRLRSFPIEQWFVDEANAEGNAIRVVVCLDQMYRGGADAAMSAYCTLFDYAMDASPPAMAALGYCYENGKGTTQDFEQAYICFSLANMWGMKSAAWDRDVAASKLSPDRLVEAQAKARTTNATIAAGRVARAGPDATVI